MWYLAFFLYILFINGHVLLSENKTDTSTSWKKLHFISYGKADEQTIDILDVAAQILPLGMLTFRWYLIQDSWIDQPFLMACQTWDCWSLWLEHINSNVTKSVKIIFNVSIGYSEYVSWVLQHWLNIIFIWLQLTVTSQSYHETLFSGNTIVQIFVNYVMCLIIYSMFSIILQISFVWIALWFFLDSKLKQSLTWLTSYSTNAEKLICNFQYLQNQGNNFLALLSWPNSWQMVALSKWLL